MSAFTFQWLYPIWIGIAMNIAAIVVNTTCIGGRSRAVNLWLDYSPRILIGAWVALLAWSAFNAWRAW